MRLVGATLCLVVLVANSAVAQERPPDFRVQIWGDISVEFSVRLVSYAELRNELEEGLPPRRVTSDPAAILMRTRVLAKRLRAARAYARPGDIFTRVASGEFRKALQAQVDPATCAAVSDDNPGSIATPINSTYPAHQPLSTMPPNVLAALPALPEDIEYRFLGRQLVLVDTRAGIVIDRMSSAIVCHKSSRTR